MPVTIRDLQERLAQTDNADIQQVFNNLMNGSYNHLQTFVSTLNTRLARPTSRSISAWKPTRRLLTVQREMAMSEAMDWTVMAGEAETVKNDEANENLR